MIIISSFAIRGRMDERVSREGHIGHHGDGGGQQFKLRPTFLHQQDCEYKKVDTTRNVPVLLWSAQRLRACPCSTQIVRIYRGG